MLGAAVQRIVHAIRKPRNNADEAIAAKPGWDGAFRAICCVAPLANGGLPLASRRFVHLIPESLRRDHAGLVQRLPKTLVGLVEVPLHSSARCDGLVRSDRLRNHAMLCKRCLPQLGRIVVMLELLVQRPGALFP